MTGDVWEYVADCWQEALPESGAAYQKPGCDARRVRGGFWDDSQRSCAPRVAAA